MISSDHHLNPINWFRGKKPADDTLPIPEIPRNHHMNYHVCGYTNILSRENGVIIQKKVLTLFFQGGQKSSKKGNYRVLSKLRAIKIL